MMVWRALIFLSLYGSLLMMSAFLALFWSMIGYVRLRIVDSDHHWLRDRAFILAAAIAATSVGTVITSGGRLLGMAHHGLSGALMTGEGWLIASGLLASCIGCVMMIWLADLERDATNYKWLKMTAAVLALWVFLSIFIAHLIPGIC